MKQSILRFVVTAGLLLWAGGAQLQAAPYPNAPEPWLPVYEMDLGGFAFSHPMTVVNTAELALVKKRLAAGLEPQATAFGILIVQADSALGFVPDPPGVMDIMGGYEPNSNLAEMRAWLWRNCHAAYTCALAWAHTGDARYADKAAEVLTAWATKGTLFTGHDRGLQLGSHFSQMMYAADLIHGYAGWSAADRTVLEGWWRSNVLVHTLNVLRTMDNNWKDAALLGVLATAVAFEDTLLLKESLMQARSYFEARYDANVADKGLWKIRKDANGTYLPREVTRNDGLSGLTYTGYGLTSMVQAFEIARYAGFDMWADTTSEGGGLTGVIDWLFRWNELGEPFPWHAAPTIRTTYKNVYEQVRFRNDASPAMAAWIDSLRPVDGTQGDEYVTLNRGGLEAHMGYVDVVCLDSASGLPVAAVDLYGTGTSGDTYYGRSNADGARRFFVPESTVFAVRTGRLGYADDTATIVIEPGSTVACTVMMNALVLTGIEISAAPPFVCLRDSFRFSASAVAEDDGRIPVPSGLVWSLVSGVQGTMGTDGTFYSGSAAGAAVIACSSTVTGFTDTVSVTVADRLRFRIDAAADAYVRDGSYASDNFGTADGLAVKQSIAGYTRWSYIVFDLSGLPAGAEPDSAVMGLYVSGNDLVYPETMPVSVFNVADTAWTESGLTWNTRPAVGDSLATMAVPDRAEERYYCDVLPGFTHGSFVPGVRAGVCLQNRGGTDNVVSFASRETGDTGPFLEVYVRAASAGLDVLPMADMVASVGETLSLDPVVTGAGASAAYTWTKTSGSDSLTIMMPAAAQTDVVFSGAGVFELLLTVIDSGDTATGTVSIDVSPAAVPYDSLVLEPLDSLTAVAGETLDVTPVVTGGNGARTYEWTRVSGPDSVVFGDAAAGTTTVRFDAPGSYVLQLAVIAGTDTVTGTVAADVSPRSGIAVPGLSVTGPRIVMSSNPVQSGIRFSAGADITGLVIYDRMGHVIHTAGTRTVRVQHVEPLRRTIGWNGLDTSGRPAPSGTYFYRITTGAGITTGSFVKIK